MSDAETIMGKAPVLSGAGFDDARKWWAAQEAKGADCNAIMMALKIDGLIGRMVHASKHPDASKGLYESAANGDAMLQHVYALVDCGYTLERVEKAVAYVQQEAGKDSSRLMPLGQAMDMARRLLAIRNGKRKA